MDPDTFASLDAAVQQLSAYDPDKLAGALGIAGAIAPHEIAIQILSSQLRTERMLAEIRDALVAQATEPAALSPTAQASTRRKS